MRLLSVGKQYFRTEATTNFFFFSTVHTTNFWAQNQGGKINFFFDEKQESFFEGADF